MNHTVMASEHTSAGAPACGGGRLPFLVRMARLARPLVCERLSRLSHGGLTLIDGTHRRTFGAAGAACPLQATITIADPRAYLAVALAGSVGAGEAYRQGWWTADDLTTLVRLFVVNRDLLDGMEQGLARVSRPVLKMLHGLRWNTRGGSRRNISAHYDLGNEFFTLMLDDTMMYSCAFFAQPDLSLADASRAKNDLICQKLRLSPSDHLLEIGTGWGGFALHAASRYGCRVTTTTISRRQHEWAVRHVAEAGLADRVTVLMTDYRDLPALGQRFDKAVSIEMIEAIGHRQYGEFFRVCADLLTASGQLLVQAITIDERFYARATRSVDFIQQFIFPGSGIPSVNALVGASAQCSDLAVVHLDAIGAHYAPTLRAWRANLDRARPAVRALGYTEEFLRLWEFYLCYCEGGFRERAIDTVQFLFSKPGWRASCPGG